MLDKLKNLSTGEKLFALAAVSLGTYLLYSYYTESDASAAEGDVAKPSQVPVSTSAPATPVAVPAYVGPARSGGPLAYLVATQTDPLNIRTGPSTSFDIIGTFAKGSTVKATGRLADGSGMVWAEVITPTGQKAWSSTTYLKPSSVKAAQVASGVVSSKHYVVGVG